jgi:NAD(P)-dependent dehydrogenase (short-subunit alcohol dehydrogenase family)
MVKPPLEKMKAGNSMSMFWWQARNPPEDPKTSFAGKTILITGANVGLGLESAIKFATLGASSLIFGVRSLQRGEEAKILICHQTGYPLSNIKILQLDMSVFASVKQFAEAVTKEVPRLDVALLNAGMAAPSYQTSPEGYEMSLQVNAISTALISILLLPKLRQTANKIGKLTHLEIVGSNGHSDITQDTLKLSPDDSIIEKISSKEFFNIMTQYSVTKLILMYAIEGIVPKTLDESGKPVVILTTVCPGLCKTNIGREFSWIMKLTNGLFQMFFARTCEEGSRTIVSGAALDLEAHGEFWSHDVFYT